jgi:hypothetical protein
VLAGVLYEVKKKTGLCEDHFRLPARPSFFCGLISEAESSVEFSFNLVQEVFYKTLFKKDEFRENPHTESHTLLRGVNKITFTLVR